MSGYLEKLERNKQDFMILCDRGHFIRQSGDPSFSGGKIIIIAGECPECDQEAKEAQQIMGRLGIPKETQNEL